MSENLYPQGVWDQGYQKAEFRPVDERDTVWGWMRAAIRRELLSGAGAPGGAGRRKRCLEIGCFPGRYLAGMGELGFELNGVDLTPRTTPEMAAWLGSLGHPLGGVTKSDFFRLDETEKFDLVYSVGFIEHFSNWEEVVAKHARLVAPGGLLLISAPNFRGRFQGWLHRAVDRGNYDRHFIPSMDPYAWRGPVGAEGLRVTEAGYFGKFDFWVGEERRDPVRRAMYYGLRLAKPVLAGLLPKDHPDFAPYLGLIARGGG